jgi:hypothetical protein
MISSHRNDVPTYYLYQDQCPRLYAHRESLRAERKLLAAEITAIQCTLHPFVPIQFPRIHTTQAIKTPITEGIPNPMPHPSAILSDSRLLSIGLPF